LGVAAVEQSHAVREGDAGRLYDEVEVVPHQAERVHPPAESPDCEAEEDEPAPAVVVRPDDPRPVHTAGGHVVGAIRKLCARNPWHRPSTVAAHRAETGTCGHIVTLF